MTYFYRPILLVLGGIILIIPFISLISIQTQMPNSMGEGRTIMKLGTFDVFFWLNYYPLALICFWAAYCLKPFKFVSNSVVKTTLTAYGVLLLCGSCIQLAHSLSWAQSASDIGFIVSYVETFTVNLAFAFIILFAGSIIVRNPKAKLDETFT